MSINILQLKTREEWLVARSSIGGSEAAALIGKSPYMSNVELWEIKTRRRDPADLSENELVKYGHKAEPCLRRLFALDHPELKVRYKANTIWKNDRYPFAHASIDGLLVRKADNALGILEIKTATIQSAVQADKWKDGIPVNYLTQCLWYMGVTEAQFVIVLAQHKRIDRNGEPYKITKEYFIDRADYESDISYLMLKGETFWRYVSEDVRPPLNLDI